MKTTPKRAAMQEVFVRWRSSGLSLKAFGEREGIAYAKLLYWKKRVVDVADGPAFAPVRIVEPAPERAETSPDVVSIWLANGISLEVPATVSERDLARMVRTLSSC